MQVDLWAAAKAEDKRHTLTREDRMKVVRAIAEAIAMLDESESEIRDVIERELAPMEGRVRIREVDMIVSRLMQEIAVIRSRAFRKAFRHIRSNLP